MYCVYVHMCIKFNEYFTMAYLPKLSDMIYVSDKC